METEGMDIIKSLIISCPAAAVCFYFCYKFWKKIDEKDNEIKELNDELRKIEIGNVEALGKLTTAVTQLNEFIKLVLKNEK